MAKYDDLSSANTLAQHATSERDQLLVHLFTEMAQKISYLEQEISQWRNNADTTAIRLNEFEAGLGKLTDLTAGGLLDPFDERVLKVLDVRSGSARAALQLEDSDVQRWMLSVIEENSGEVFEHIEAEIDEKLEGFLESYSFAEAVANEVKGALGSTVEEILDELLHDAIIEAIGDPEDIVRKGLRSIL
jgi:hypothetical protein